MTSEISVWKNSKEKQKLMNNSKDRLIELVATNMNDPTIYLPANVHMVRLSLLLTEQSRDEHKQQRSDQYRESEHPQP